MAEQSPYIEQIDAYLRKQLSPEEQSAFEQALESDPDLKIALKTHLEALVAIRQKGFLEEIERGVGEANLASANKGKTRRLSPIWLFATAAAILLIAVAVWWLFPAAQNDQSF